MTEDLVLLDVDDAVATVTLNNPAKRGALSLEAMQRLTDTFREVGGRDDVHAVILASVGKVFSSGHNLAEMAGDDRARHERFFAASAALMLAIREIPQPVIARVHAHTAAAGCQLVAGCDLAVAAENVQFSIAGLRIGMFPTLPAVALSRTVGDKMALRMLLTGDVLTAEHA
ncbi:MAG: enoyl-CoA hydratase, partial [Propionibacterium sp.]|nr:enoyl-CoA hydratase [Propionibacterium sp.]